MLAPDGLHLPFTDAGWLYEIKFDGYRCLAEIEADDGGDHTADPAAMATRVQLRTKSGADCTTWYPEVMAALAKLPGGPPSSTERPACCGRTAPATSTCCRSAHPGSRLCGSP